MAKDPLAADPLMAALAKLGLDSVDGAFCFAGGTDLDRPGLAHRRRTRFTVTDNRGCVHTLYMKRYAAEPLAWRARRVVTYGLGRSPAAVEFENIRTAHATGLPTMRALVFGQEQNGLGVQRSYLVFTAVPGESLASCAKGFIAAHGTGSEPVCRLTSGLANLIRRLHLAGYVHRDLYASHVFLDRRDGRLDLYLIDLARMFAPRWRTRRWLIKDLAQLRFSMPPEWVKHHWQAFMCHYMEGAPAAEIAAFSLATERKATRIFQQLLRRQQVQTSQSPAK